MLSRTDDRRNMARSRPCLANGPCAGVGRIGRAGTPRAETHHQSNESLISNILFLGVLAALLIPAKKWAGMNPYRIDDGPSWVVAAWSALYTMVLFMLAVGSQRQGNPKATAFFGSFAFGSAIGAYFLTQFKPSPEEVPSGLLRWWTGTLDGIADSAFKSVLVAPTGWIISTLSSFDGRFWAAVLLAQAKTGVAMLQLNSDRCSPHGSGRHAHWRKRAVDRTCGHHLPCPLACAGGTDHSELAALSRKRLDIDRWLCAWCSFALPLARFKIAFTNLV